MFKTTERLLLILLATICGIRILPRSTLIAGALFLAAVLLAVGYFRYGTIWRAYRALKKGRLDRAELLVDEIHLPGWLRAQDRAYYEMLEGVIAAEKEDFETAENHLRAAIAGKLRTQNDICAARVTLADVLLERGEPEAAAATLGEARAHEHRPELDAHLDRVEEKIRGG